MEVTIKITGEDGQIREVSRTLNINRSVDILQEIEREIGLLHQTLSEEVFAEVLNTEQSVYSLEKKNLTLSRNVMVKNRLIFIRYEAILVFPIKNIF